ncbi:3075_t:CDS:2 [Entrophospora sp. SA101]|nr:3075_t:CDS:2 [Entrophospora sp. SA101]
MSEKDAANDKLRKETIEYQNLYSTLVAKYNDLVQEYNNSKEKLLSQIAINEGLYEKQNNHYVSQLNRLKKHNSELQLQHDHFSELQDKIQSYITNLRTSTAELDYNNIDNLLIKYNYVTGTKEIQRNKPLVKALLQRAVFDKLIELLKDFGSDTYQYKSRDLDMIYMNWQTNYMIIHLNLIHMNGEAIVFDLLYTVGYNDNNDNKEHGFIKFNKQLLDQHISQYRKIIDQRKQTELATLSGEIIRDFVKIFHFTLLEDLDDLEICWILNGSAIDSEFMEGQWDYNNIDNYVIEICRFPLIRSSKKIYSLAKVFADKLDNSNATIESHTTTYEVIKWKENAESRWTTETRRGVETVTEAYGWDYDPSGGWR